MMAIFSNGLAYTIVIVVLISPEITTQVVSPPPPDSPPGNVSQPIRPKDNTIRVDPYDNFKKYRGGFNITNKHYWSSVVFAGVYGYAIGLLWLLCGILCGLFFLIINCCCQSFGGNKGCDLLPIPLAILLLIIAMAASGLVLAGSAKFRCHASSSVNVIINTADEASGIIFNITGALKGIPTELVDADIASKLNTTSQRFDTAAQDITQEAAKNRHIINMALKALFIFSIVTVSLNLVFVISISVFGVLRVWKALYLFVVLCWLLTVICWILFGVYFFLEKFSDDTCNALYNFQENPYNNSLSSMIPCDELLSAKPIVSEISSGIYNLVNEVNGGLSKYQGALLPNRPNICNPFSAPPDFLYQPWNCSPDSTKIGDIPEVLRPYTCFGDEDEICGREKFIPGSEYEVIKEYTSSVQNLLDVYPSVESLLGCQLVKDAFSQVLQKHCKPLKRFSKVTWAAMVSLAATMVPLVVLWTMKANYHEHNHQP